MRGKNGQVSVTNAGGGFNARLTTVFSTTMWDLHAHDIQFIYIPYSARACRDLVVVMHFLSKFLFYGFNFHLPSCYVFLARFLEKRSNRVLL